MGAGVWKRARRSHVPVQQHAGQGGKPIAARRVARIETDAAAPLAQRRSSYGSRPAPTRERLPDPPGQVTVAGPGRKRTGRQALTRGLHEQLLHQLFSMFGHVPLCQASRATPATPSKAACGWRARRRGSWPGCSIARPPASYGRVNSTSANLGRSPCKPTWRARSVRACVSMWTAPANYRTEAGCNVKDTYRAATRLPDWIHPLKTDDPTPTTRRTA